LSTTIISVSNLAAVRTQLAASSAHTKCSCFGSVLGYMATVTHGSAIVFPSESFDAFLTLKAVQEEKCTALYGVPTMFLAGLELLQHGKVSSEGFQYLRTGIAAGSSIPVELMKRLHSKLNLTELSKCYFWENGQVNSC
jgi:acyl-CoA synthetase (AMP-forming)/AMP-acid ligase II